MSALKLHLSIAQKTSNEVFIIYKQPKNKLLSNKVIKTTVIKLTL